jgi:ubiquinone biosynthesis protein UbiJ
VEVGEVIAALVEKVGMLKEAVEALKERLEKQD